MCWQNISLFSVTFVAQQKTGQAPIRDVIRKKHLRKSWTLSLGGWGWGGVGLVHSTAFLSFTGYLSHHHCSFSLVCHCYHVTSLFFVVYYSKIYSFSVKLVTSAFCKNKSLIHSMTFLIRKLRASKLAINLRANKQFFDPTSSK